MSLLKLPGEIGLEATVAKGGNFGVEIGFADLAAGVSNTPLVLSAFSTLGNLQGIELDHIELITPFQDTSDTAQNTTGLIIGDAGSTNRHLTTTELNANGSFVTLAYGTGTKFVPTTNTPVTFTFTPTAGKNVANLKAGKLLAFFKLRDTRVGI